MWQEQQQACRQHLEEGQGSVVAVRWVAGIEVNSLAVVLDGLSILLLLQRAVALRFGMCRLLCSLLSV